MTADDSAPPLAPHMRPLGPLIEARDLEIWQKAVDARAAAERHLQRVRGWARRAYQLERARGRAEGVTAGAEEMAQLVAQATSEVARRNAALEEELPQLVMEIVTDLLGAFDPGEMLVRTVRHAILRKYGGAELSLHVSPLNADALAREFAACDGREGRPTVRIVPDPALPSHECVLRSEFGNVDLGLAAQLRALRRGLGLPPEAGEL
ncbi:type III secretion system stator protein SctL [Bradyrhizobium arachidis]|uniref:type III secretion system stator protein SctL n=1 Tax=Bradyrhizobium arachidis TaxID=858423 RepID=UPI002162275A|nr:type III secretion system stator protein SctL [Bradyrhizobium arachidis]UVO30371.1 type III secretion system stator protein SctL [Bradyrhizobium arachidis]